MTKEEGKQVIKKILSKIEKNSCYPTDVSGKNKKQKTKRRLIPAHCTRDINISAHFTAQINISTYCIIDMNKIKLIYYLKNNHILLLEKNNFILDSCKSLFYIISFL